MSWVSTAEIIPAAEPEEDNGVWPPLEAEAPAAQQVAQLPGAAFEPGVAQNSPSFGRNAVRAANALAVAEKEVDCFLEAESPQALPLSARTLQAPQVLAIQQTADSSGSNVRPPEAVGVGRASVQLGHVAEALGGVHETPQRRLKPTDPRLRTPRTPANSERTDSSTDQPPASGRGDKLLPAPAAPQLIRRNSDPSAATPMPAQHVVGMAKPRVAAQRAVSFSQRTQPPNALLAGAQGKRSYQPTAPLAAEQGQVHAKSAQSLQAKGAASGATPHPEPYPLTQRPSGGAETAADHKLLQRLPSASESAGKQPVVRGSRAATADLALHPASQPPNFLTAEPEIHAAEVHGLIAAAAGTSLIKASEPATEPVDELAKKSQAPTVRNRAATADVTVESAPNNQTVNAGTTGTAVQPAKAQPIVLQAKGGATSMAAAAVDHLPIAAGAAAAPVLPHVAPGQGVHPAAESANKQIGPSRTGAATADIKIQPALKSDRQRGERTDITMQPAQEQAKLPHPSRATAAVSPRPLPTAATAAAAEVVPEKAPDSGVQPTKPTNKQSPLTSRSKNRAATTDILIQPAGDVRRGRAASATTVVKPTQLNEAQPKVGASAAAQTPAQRPPVSQKPAGVFGMLKTAAIEVVQLGGARTVKAEAMRIVETGVEHLAEAAVAKIAGRAVERALEAQLAQWSSATSAGVTTQSVESTQSESRQQRAATTEIATHPVPPKSKLQRRRTLAPATQMSVSSSLHPASDDWLPAASEPPAAGKEPTAHLARKPARRFNRSRSAAASRAGEPLQQQQTQWQRAATADVGSAPAQPSHSRFSPGSRTVSAIQESEDPEAPGSARDHGLQLPNVLPADTSMQQPDDLSSLTERAPVDGLQAWGQDQSEVLSEVDSIQGGLTDVDQPHAGSHHVKAYSLQGPVTDVLIASEQNNRSGNNPSPAESVSQQDSHHVGGRQIHSCSLPGTVPAVSFA